MSYDFYRNELNNALHAFRHRSKTTLNAAQQELLASLSTKGWAIIPPNENEFNTKAAIDELNALFKAYPEQLWLDEAKADRRLFGVESQAEELAKFWKNQQIQDVLDAYMGMSHTKKITMGGHIKSLEKNLGSGGGWHRDSSSFNQVKSIVYLTDVDQEQGPFEYLEGSHVRNTYLTTSRLLAKPWKERRFTDEEVDRLRDEYNFKSSYFTGKAGTILLVDTSGIHRGMPLRQGERYALTNYIWYHRKDYELLAHLIIPND